MLAARSDLQQEETHGLRGGDSSRLALPSAQARSPLTGLRIDHVPGRARRPVSTALHRSLDMLRISSRPLIKASLPSLRPRWLAWVIAAGVLSSGTSRGSAGAELPSSSAVPSEVHAILGEGVVEALETGVIEAPPPSSDPSRLAWWEPGEWIYRITAGARRGKTLSEILAPIDASERGETWTRTIGEEYTLYVNRTPDGSLVLPSEIAHTHKALVHFDPPLTYLTAALEAGGTRAFDGKMDVYRVRNPDTKWISGRIRATTQHAGTYRVKTPAGTFSATLVKTDYKIDIFAVVSVTDTLYTFYAEGIGKVAEAERQRVSMSVLETTTQFGKVLVRFIPARNPVNVQAP